jgi:hypothetical protein
MADIQQRFLGCVLLVALLAPAVHARKFYDDDPLWKLPAPVDVGKIKMRKLSEYYDFFSMTFAKPGEKTTPVAPVRAGGTNTVDEVPDSLWYTNRHGKKRMSIEELVRGPGDSNPPAMDGPWMITAAKSEGVTPGFTIKDPKGRRYQVKFDTEENFELPSGADVMGTKFFYALGYFTPENYIVYFDASRLRVQPGTKFIDRRGVERDLRQTDVEKVLETVPKDRKTGQYRAIASLYLSGEPVGPFRYYGVRTDDPNDLVPHEHRRDLRGLKVFSAWLNHTDTKALNSLDMLIQQDGKHVIRHHLIDFSAAFGTDAFEPKSPRAGYVYLFDWTNSAKEFFTFGLYVPAWSRAHYEHVKGAGRIEADVFDPEDWKSHYYNPAFSNCLPDDGFWAAKQVMRFTEPEIRALVATARYTDKEAEEYLARILIARQRKIGEKYFRLVLPLDNFRVDGDSLAFDDLGVQYGITPQRNYVVRWSAFDNQTETKTPVRGASSRQVPRGDAGYLVADIDAGQPGPSVSVYVRNRSGRHEVVGVERFWLPRAAAAPASARARASQAIMR